MTGHGPTTGIGEELPLTAEELDAYGPAATAAIDWCALRAIAVLNTSGMTAPV